MRNQYDEGDVRRFVESLASQIVAEFNPLKPLNVIGIRTRGETLAQRLTDELKQLGFQHIGRGVLDITLYRDDLSEVGPRPMVRPTQINIAIDGIPLLLVDDVLFTGRSIRAALDALSDFGRPSAIELAVLVDRGGARVAHSGRLCRTDAEECPARSSCERAAEGERWPRRDYRGAQELTMSTEAPALWTRKHLLGLHELSADELRFILDTADSFKEVSTRSVKKVPALRGRVVVNAFWEDSTRTRVSFQLAAQRLSADTIDFSEKSSSVSKGETLIDTARNIEAMGVDVIVIRHPAAGAAQLLSRTVKCSIVNAGDGAHEHPTQGLLDLYTIRERFGKVEGLKVAIVGDIANSRVARSNLFALTKLGAEVILVGPPTLLSRSFEQLGARITHDFDSVIGEVDVVNMLRVQFERIKSSQFPTVREFTSMYGLTWDRFQRCKKDVFVMHPGPMNRGIEIQSDIADGAQSGILQQVTNGLAVRMAVLYLVTQAG
jgi:aspartate carbamoyltransferase catalytic subunit